MFLVSFLLLFEEKKGMSVCGGFIAPCFIEDVWLGGLSPTRREVEAMMFCVSSWLNPLRVSELVVLIHGS